MSSPPTSRAREHNSRSYRGWLVLVAGVAQIGCYERRPVPSRREPAADVTPTSAALEEPHAASFRWLVNGMAQMSNGATFYLNDIWVHYPSGYLRESEDRWQRRIGEVQGLRHVDQVTSISACGLPPRGGCALWPRGEVRCWGGAQFGAMGDNCKVDDTCDTPRSIQLVGVAERLFLRPGRTCASMSLGRVFCWKNQSSQTCAPDDAGYEPPCARTDATCRRATEEGAYNIADTRPLFDKARLPGVIQAEGHGDTGCALHRDGEVVCWGHLRPPTGTPPTDREKLLGAPIDDVHDAIEIGVWTTKDESGEWRACARIRNGSLRCWAQRDTPPALEGPFTVLTVQLTPPTDAPPPREE